MLTRADVKGADPGRQGSTKSLSKKFRRVLRRYFSTLSGRPAGLEGAARPRVINPEEVAALLRPYRSTRVIRYALKIRYNLDAAAP